MIEIYILLSGSAVLVECLKGPELSPGGREVVLEVGATQLARLAEEGSKTQKVEPVLYTYTPVLT